MRGSLELLYLIVIPVIRPPRLFSVRTGGGGGGGAYWWYFTVHVCPCMLSIFFTLGSTAISDPVGSNF